TRALATWYVLSVNWAAAWVLADLVLLVSRWEIIRNGRLQSLPGKRQAVHWLLILGLLWALCLGLGIYGGYRSGHTALMILATAVGAGTVGVAASRNAATPRQA